MPEFYGCVRDPKWESRGVAKLGMKSLGAVSKEEETSYIAGETLQGYKVIKKIKEQCSRLLRYFDG